MGCAGDLAAIRGTLVPVMVERPAAAGRETRVFARGNRLSKEEAVTPGLPAIFAADEAAECKTRLDMARWLVGPRNPLTARVAVNRLWGELFGTGLVRTMEDFGTSGDPPSHPELLDHLALRLRDHHRWSVKAMLREIVLSSTYGQSHRAAPELVARDPGNRLLAHGPRCRLTAEMVRDQSLAVAGLLSDKMFGPPVYPPQPAGVWNSVYSGAVWHDSQGDDRYRRGIYTYAKRTSGYPGVPDLRRAEPGLVQRAADREQHAAAGVGHAERSGAHRGGAGLGQADGGAAGGPGGATGLRGAFGHAASGVAGDDCRA